MKASIPELRQTAHRLRRDIIEMAYTSAVVTHEAPALSCIDLVTALYYRFMRVDPQNPAWEERDRFVLSKGHGYLALYAALADLGFFSKEHYSTVRHTNSILQGHPTYGKTPGVDMTTGSLGNGLGIGLGMAYYLKHLKKKSKVFVVLGDGECNEGTVWESVISAPALGADNLVAIVDYNHFQSCDSCENIIPMGPMADKWKAFGWNVLEVNGHDMTDIVSKLEVATNYSGAPTVIIAHTIKGKGVSFMEHNNSYHNIKLCREDYIRAVKELEEEVQCL